MHDGGFIFSTCIHSTSSLFKGIRVHIGHLGPRLECLKGRSFKIA